MMMVVTDSYVSYRVFCNGNGLDHMKHRWINDAKDLVGAKHAVIVMAPGHQALGVLKLNNIRNYARCHGCLVVVPG